MILPIYVNVVFNNILIDEDDKYNSISHHILVIKKKKKIGFFVSLIRLYYMIS